MKKISGTAKRLLARGFSTELSLKIANQGYNISKLKQTGDDELLILGLSEAQIKSIRSEKRPPISAKTINKLLYESRFCCCVCHDFDKPIVIHHLVMWEISHSHDYDNLVVLCHNHHNEAHTTHDLSISLSIDKIKDFKKKWIEESLKNESKEILKLLDNAFSACWDFFNVKEIYKFFLALKFDVSKGKTYEYLLKNNFIDESGFLLPETKWEINKTEKSYWLDFFGGFYIAEYLAKMFIEIIKAIPFRILNFIWTKIQIREYLKPGSFVYLQAGFSFKNDSETKNTGNGTNRIGYRRAQGIELRFHYNDYNCTSFSARCDHMTGKRIISFFGLVREVKEVNGKLTIFCTSIAVGSCFYQIFDGRTFYPFDIDTEEEEDEDENFEYDFNYGDL